MPRTAYSESQYDSLRENLNPTLAGLSDAQLESVLARQGIEAEAMEGFFDDLGKFAAKAAPAVLPIAGQVVGSIYGGPAGGAIGSQLGSLAGGAIASAAGGSKPSPPAAAPGPSMAGTATPPAAAAPGGGSPAAGQLLQTITRPETLQALASMAMGLMGKQNVSVGGTQVPVSAFSNLLGTLAGRAEAEYNATLARNEGLLPEYLLDYAGEPKGDPAIASQRAEALYELLGTTEAATEAAESSEASEASEAAEAGEALSEWEAEADAAELLELAEGYESEEA